MGQRASGEQWSHLQGRLGGQAVLSLLPRDHAERRACMRGPQGTHDDGEGDSGELSGGGGHGEQVGSPPLPNL